MKKAFALSLCAIMILTFTLVACSKNDDDGEPTTAPKSTAQASDLDNSGDEYGVETETVTNDRGKAVTDNKGNKVTTDVAVVYKKAFAFKCKNFTAHKVVNIISDFVGVSAFPSVRLVRI